MIVHVRNNKHFYKDESLETS